jgi:acetyl esterase/lipase
MMLAQFGFAVVDINYTLVPNTTLYGQIRDVFAAVHWLIENGGNYLCDTRNMFITGDSAGGQLALLANAVNKNKGFLNDFGVHSFSSEIRAMGLTCPVPFLKQMYDSRDVLQNEQMRLLLRGNPAQSFLWNYADPRNYLSECDLPPIYLLTTKGDGKYYAQSEELRNVLSALGSDFEYVEWMSCENKTLGHVFNVLYPEELDGYQANKQMAEYFRTFIQE